MELDVSKWSGWIRHTLADRLSILNLNVLISGKEWMACRAGLKECVCKKTNWNLHHWIMNLGPSVLTWYIFAPYVFLIISLPQVRALMEAKCALMSFHSTTGLCLFVLMTRRLRMGLLFLSPMMPAMCFLCFRKKKSAIHILNGRCVFSLLQNVLQVFNQNVGWNGWIPGPTVISWGLWDGGNQGDVFWGMFFFLEEMWAGDWFKTVL